MNVKQTFLMYKWLFLSLLFLFNIQLSVAEEDEEDEDEEDYEDEDDDNEDDDNNGGAGGADNGGDSSSVTSNLGEPGTAAAIGIFAIAGVIFLGICYHKNSIRRREITDRTNNYDDTLPTESNHVRQIPSANHSSLPYNQSFRNSEISIPVTEPGDNVGHRGVDIQPHHE
uniref:Uncharacterized protein n=1 Tax=Aplanochytrium stocchinoi TaxID=215587 RepID=A0A7S3V2K2_9STRA|mmetsp:Transcript_12937/g.16791  ORF Transcript_12937/g.16791 Transcript_12937/m.16791 type:complete len:170 (+) Transcript_12937:220-729(+)|eukprot:CAMPEP_0204867818 /NCGR_PEP_ID=MMETSP1348-20121228/24264_1 /ASSEMBLY_ACC=CAM_ASM_000700 /TAXON_ID=215587 /ORGANISM="Aplanochytrium stocchinoi, Strain GSBS06" /LENGTH=169 /DNA_ID=CAMNT_0052020435 /DNA_START=114 /DNA_END=623 /DNA_ORIENTATION=+